VDGNLIATLAVAITGGSTLGATIAGFFAYRQKSLVTLLRESNKDYKERVEQLESDRDRFEKLSKEQTAEIAQLKAEKALPLDNLTKLITSQHQLLISAITELTKALANKEGK
jgi:3-hydroxyacyl-CoA dehydrogenase